MCFPRKVVISIHFMIALEWPMVLIFLGSNFNDLIEPHPSRCFQQGIFHTFPTSGSLFAVGDGELSCKVVLLTYMGEFLWN